MAMIAPYFGMAGLAGVGINSLLITEGFYTAVSRIEDLGASELVQVNWIEEITKGGATMIFIGALSVLGVAILMERLFAVRRSNLVPQATIDEIGRAGETGNHQRLLQMCEGKTDLLAQAVTFVLRRQKNPYAVVKDAVADFAGREIRSHLARVQLLSAVAGIAPLLGLLGTMIGMIESFKLVSVYGDEGGASILADSISKALITTAAGLIVAIPTLGAFYWMKHRVYGLATELEIAVERVLNMVYLSETTVPEKISSPPDDLVNPSLAVDNAETAANDERS